MPFSKEAPPNSILVIQTAFLGDVILASSVIEKLHRSFPKCTIDFLLRKGNESLFKSHPFLNEVLIWNKKKGKIASLFRTIKKVRSKNYDVVINLHRFTSSGIITVLSRSKLTIGFDKNPLSFFFNKAIKHELNTGKHEVERNLELINTITEDTTLQLPKLYPSASDFATVAAFKEKSYICIAPTSVWFTKQLPKGKWIDLIAALPLDKNCYLLGAPEDFEYCESIKKTTATAQVFSLAGKLSLLESAALMQGAQMNYANDSAPLHMASAMNAPITAVYCSTIPAFGFGPLSNIKFTIETTINLSCKPCGLHGYKACPEGHFRCATSIAVNDLVSTLKLAP